MTPEGIRRSLALLLLAAPGAALAQTAYDFGNPSPEAQEIMEFTNRARANPPAEGARLAATQDEDVLSAVDFFDVDLGVFTAEMNQIAPRPPLAWSTGLINAATAHSQRMIQDNVQTHDRPGGIGLLEDFQNHGYDVYVTGGRGGENIYAYADSAWHSHAGWVIDWGGNGTPDGMQPTRGHRANILNEITTGNPTGEPYREMGVAVIPDPKDGAQDVGPLVITQEFGRRTGHTFLSGVVYEDANDNDFYDAGEGVSGVEVHLNEGDWYAVTAAAGGYTIPLEGKSGRVTVTFSGGGLEQDQSATVVLTDENRKLDVRDSDIMDGGAFGGPWDFVAGGDDGWSKSSWFDWVYVHPDQWVFSPGFGWSYYFGTSQSMALWDPSLGWVWTSQNTFPFFYQYESGRWLYWYQTTPWPGRWFHVVDQNGTSVGDFHESDL